MDNFGLNQEHCISMSLPANRAVKQIVKPAAKKNKQTKTKWSNWPLTTAIGRYLVSYSEPTDNDDNNPWSKDLSNEETSLAHWL